MQKPSQNLTPSLPTVQCVSQIPPSSRNISGNLTPSV